MNTEDILAKLVIKLEITKESDINILSEILNDAIAEVTEARRYPSTMSAEAIEADLQKYTTNIKNLAIYDYNQRGIEGQDEHSENGIARSYFDRAKCFIGVLPYANVIA